MPLRKLNRLADYDYSQPGAYFLTVCVKDRACVLGSIVGADDHIGPQPNPVGTDDYIGPHIDLSNVGKIVEKYTCTIPGIDQYVIMPNHVHMILRISAKDPLEGPMWSSAPTDTSIITLVRTWKTLITKELGVSIWQRSYYDHVIRDEQDYLTKVQYMINNPAKWYEDQYYCGY